MSCSLLCHQHCEDYFVPCTAKYYLFINEVVLPIVKNPVREMKLRPMKQAHNANVIENNKTKPVPKAFARGYSVGQREKKHY